MINDDYCILGAQITYDFRNEDSCQDYILRQGCYADTECRGTVTILVDAPQQPVLMPTSSPSTNVTDDYKWVIRGQDIDGEAGQKLGQEVAISSDGYVLATRLDGNINVYSWNPGYQSWTVRGHLYSKLNPNPNLNPNPKL